MTEDFLMPVTAGIFRQVTANLSPLITLLL